MTLILPSRGKHAYPQRRMIAGDLFPPKPTHDEILATIGMDVPALTYKQRNINMMRGVAALHRAKSLSKHAKVMRRFNKTAAGKAAKREISAILQRMRWAGECRG